MLPQLLNGPPVARQACPAPFGDFKVKPAGMTEVQSAPGIPYQSLHQDSIMHTASSPAVAAAPPGLRYLYLGSSFSFFCLFPLSFDCHISRALSLSGIVPVIVFLPPPPPPRFVAGSCSKQPHPLHKHSLSVPNRRLGCFLPCKESTVRLNRESRRSERRWRSSCLERTRSHVPAPALHT